MSKIAIDADGVLANFTEAYIDAVNSIWPGRIEHGYEPPDWDFGNRLTKAEDRRVWVKIKATENFWLTLNAYYGNVGALARWLIVHKGHDIYIVTSRSRTAGMSIAMQTDHWLRAAGIQPVHNYLAVLPVEDSNEKWKVYQHGGFDYSIDDKKETVEQCDFIHEGVYTHKAFLLDRPWNQDAKVKRRVNGLEAFLAEVK